MLQKLKCFFGYHEIYKQRINITYKLLDTTGFITELHGKDVGNRVTIFRRCRYCHYEKEDVEEMLAAAMR